MTEKFGDVATPLLKAGDSMFEGQARPFKGTETKGAKSKPPRKRGRPQKIDDPIRFTVSLSEDQARELDEILPLVGVTNRADGVRKAIRILQAITDHSKNGKLSVILRRQDGDGYVELVIV